MSSSKLKYKSIRAADKALKRTSVNLVNQLDLFDTTLHLHAMDGLTLLETEQLGNSYKTELERKQYLVTTVIPRKGQYKGMKLLMRALKQTEQYEILSLLEKTYDEEVDAIISKKPELKHKSREGYPVQATASECGDSINSAMLSDSSLVYKDDSRNTNSPTMSISSSSDDDDDDDDAISLDSPVVEQQPRTEIILPPNPPAHQPSQSPYYIRLSGPITTSSPHRPRSGHISLVTNPYKAKSTEQCIIVTVNPAPDHENPNSGAASNIKHSNDLQQSVDQLICDSPIMKFVFVGDTGTGKTSLLERYINKKFSIASKPATMIDFMSTELTCYDIKYKLHLWDTAGQERFRALTNQYYRDAVGGFVVYDVTQRTSLDHCLQWKRNIDNVVQFLNGDPIPIVLIANKIDCGRLDGEQFSKENGFAGYFETSAKTGAGVKEAIHFMVKKVHELSCADQEPVEQTPHTLQTLTRNCSISIKLEFNKEERKRCCRQH